MFYTIYKTINLLNGKFYIGKHQTENIHDLYYGSGSLIKSAISKYGKKNFKKEILFVFDNELEMNEKEKELVNEELINQINTYNVGIGGEGGPHFKGKKHSIDNIEKMIETGFAGYTTGDDKCSIQNLKIQIVEACNRESICN